MSQIHLSPAPTQGSSPCSLLRLRAHGCTYGCCRALPWPHCTLGPASISLCAHLSAHPGSGAWQPQVIARPPGNCSPPGDAPSACVLTGQPLVVTRGWWTRGVVVAPAAWTLLRDTTTVRGQLGVGAGKGLGVEASCDRAGHALQRLASPATSPRRSHLGRGPPRDPSTAASRWAARSCAPSTVPARSTASSHWPPCTPTWPPAAPSTVGPWQCQGDAGTLWGIPVSAAPRP